MIASHNIPPEGTSVSSARTVVDARDEWSAISRLPQHIAEQVRLERRLEITPSSVWSQEYSEEVVQARTLSALDRLSMIKAHNPTEAMLAAQMVNTYEAYVDCHRRAMINADNVILYSTHMKNAERLSNLYMRQLSALDKHRGRGKQQVRVEHVHVAAGGQAVVGHLDVRSDPNRTPVQRRSDLVNSDFSDSGGADL